MLLPEHGRRVIDFLKIESPFEGGGDEWDIIPNLLTSGVLKEVRQMEILVRLKGTDSAPQHRLKTATVKSLEDAAFVRFSSTPRGNRIYFSAFEFFDFAEFQLSWFNGRLKP